MDYVSGKEPTDGFTQRLNDEIEKARTKEEWRIEYMTLLQRDREKRAEGKLEKLIEQIICKIKKDKSIEIISDELEEDVDKVKRIYDIAIKHAPEFDVDAIYEELNK